MKNTAFLLIGLAMAALPAHASDAGPPAEKKPAAKEAPAKEPLGDAFIAQNTLRVYLSRPATISLHNAMGQVLFTMDSFRSVEILPLNGVTTGFLYLTLRVGGTELTKKLVHTGK